MFRYLFFLFLTLFLVQCSEQTEVRESDVSRVLRTLSADEMEGRKLFSEGLKRAADFIEVEFEEAGLQPIHGEDDLRQSFTIIKRGTTTVSGTMNGREIDSDQVFALGSHDVIQWDDPNNFEVHYLKPHHRRSQIDSLLKDGRNSLILVNRQNERWFNRARRWYTSERYGIFPAEEHNSGTSAVFIRSDRTFRDLDLTITSNFETHEISNITGMIEGKRKDEIVLFSAHYDHIGIVNPVRGDSISNGANDNASGVTAVIKLADHFSGLSKPERTIYFVAFTAEEAGGLGSEYFSEKVNSDLIVAMFNIEMIGKPAVDGPNSAYITGYDHSDLGKILAEYPSDSFRFYPDPYTDQRLFMRSDNFRFALQGVPAHSISTTPIDVDRDYHEVSDEFETIDISHMTSTIEAIARASQPVISASRTPQRIDTTLFN